MQKIEKIELVTKPGDRQIIRILKTARKKNIPVEPNLEQFLVDAKEEVKPFFSSATITVGGKTYAFSYCSDLKGYLNKVTF